MNVKTDGSLAVSSYSNDGAHVNHCIVTVERLTCVAKWKEGNKRYFVALVNSQHSQWAEELDRYQCFLYEDISNTMRMAQGQFSASCQGLWSVLEGSRTFSLQKRESAQSDINN